MTFSKRLYVRPAPVKLRRSRSSLRIWPDRRSTGNAGITNRNIKDYHVTPKARQQSTNDPKPKSSTTPEPEQIASLAYVLWQQRGCPEGSPEADWLRAEE